MIKKNKHEKILLSKNTSGKVEFCEDCDIVELEIGAISLRLQADDIKLFGALIDEAAARLRFHKKYKMQYDENVRHIKGLH